MTYINQKKYYTNDNVSPTNENWGSYQKVFLSDLINNYMLIYYGNNNLTNNTERFKVIFFAKRCIQELSYDASATPISLQLTVGENLKFIFPPDYVNFIKLSLYKNNRLVQMTESIQVMSAIQYQQDSNAEIEFYGDDVILVEPSEIDGDRLNGHLKTMYLNQNNPNDQLNGEWGWWIGNQWYFEQSYGRRFGLNTETATNAPTYSIDRAAGVINFSSDMINQSCILEYISDGLYNNDDSQIYVNKMFEAYVYAYIEYEIMSSKLGVQQYTINSLKQKKSALLSNAKIRISNLHPARLLMNMRGMDKILK